MKKLDLHRLKIGDSKIIRPNEFATKVRPKTPVLIKFQNGYETEMFYEGNVDKKVFIFKAAK